MNRKEVNEDLCDLLSGNDDMDAEKFVATVQYEIAAAKKKGGYIRFTVSSAVEKGYYGDCDSYSTKLVGVRLENDAEFEKRTAADKEWQDRQRARELAQFEELRKKFGK